MKERIERREGAEGQKGAYFKKVLNHVLKDERGELARDSYRMRNRLRKKEEFLQS